MQQTDDQMDKQTETQDMPSTDHLKMEIKDKDGNWVEAPCDYGDTILRTHNQ